MIVISLTCTKVEDFEIIEYNFDYIIGKSYCVPTTQKDKIYFKKRPGRNGESRFVVNREPTPTSHLTFITKKINEGYICLTAFIGSPAPPEPFDPKANKKSIDFWNNHALIEEN